MQNVITNSSSSSSSNNMMTCLSLHKQLPRFSSLSLNPSEPKCAANHWWNISIRAIRPVDAVSSLDYTASKARASECKRKNKAWIHFITVIAGPREPDISTQDLPNTKTTTFGSKDICIMRINRTIYTTTIQTWYTGGRMGWYHRGWFTIQWYLG